MYRTVTPKEAKQLLDSEGYTYVDVRSVPEFEEEHAEGAVNVPLMHADPYGGMRPNPDFVRVMESAFAKDAKLVCACKAGGRSARACATLESAGFTDLVNMDGGFHGRFGPAGDLVQAGWTQEGLAVTTNVAEGTDYESLASKGR